jgi:predicted amidohydrolase YtcJ
MSHATLAPDVVIRAGAIYSMAPNRAVYRAIAIRDEWILAVSEDTHGLDTLIGPSTQVVERSDLTLLPAFFDTHNHLFEAALNTLLVSVDRARSVAEFVDLVRHAAAQTPAGHWIRTTNAWNQANLAERRPPTAQELDAATTNHPVFAQRGGHLACVNSRALQLAGITNKTPDPPGGAIARLPDGTPSGVLEGAAVMLVSKLLLPPVFEDQVGALRTVCQQFNTLGLGAVRAPMITTDQMLVYQAAWERGWLTLRAQPLINVLPFGSVEERIATVAQWGVRSGFGDDWLRIWGLKFVLDGGPEGAAMEQPFTSDPTAQGHLNWEPDEMFAVADAAVKRGWKIATHALGDRTVRTLLDVYERVIEANPTLPSRSLVIEHGFLANREQRARAIRLGIPVTVQHPLLFGMAAALLRLWGPERTRNIMPVRAWLDEGAQVSAGTDYPAGSVNPIEAIWGMVTRQTRDAGVQGDEYAVDPYTAFWLYTAAGAQLVGEDDRRGTLQPGRLADVVGFVGNPVTASTDDLRAFTPAFTLVGGRAMHDPDGTLRPQR